MSTTTIFSLTVKLFSRAPLFFTLLPIAPFLLVFRRKIYGEIKQKPAKNLYREIISYVWWPRKLLYRIVWRQKYYKIKDVRLVHADIWWDLFGSELGLSEQLLQLNKFIVNKIQAKNTDYPTITVAKFLQCKQKWTYVFSFSFVCHQLSIDLRSIFLVKFVQRSLKTTKLSDELRFEIFFWRLEIIEIHHFNEICHSILWEVLKFKKYSNSVTAQWF